MSRLEGKIAVVTGGGSGIGRATCLKFAQEDAIIAIASNVAAEVEAVTAEVRAMGRRAEGFVVDVTDLAAVEKLAADVEAALGPADILVTCAGVMGARKLITETTPEEWRWTMAVNLDGTFYCIKAFLPGMLERDSGRIITLSSGSGKQPAALNSDYSASKHGVIGLTKTVAIELGIMNKNGVTANSLCPGPIATPMMDAIADHFAPGTTLNREEFLDKSVAKNIQRRLLDPSEVAGMAAYLASDEAKGITGQAINVCGGIVLH
jgi:NAD(P)-dependent dehydrogenase (short-subunit alcohol dehydrogenase family)